MATEQLAQSAQAMVPSDELSEDGKSWLIFFKTNTRERVSQTISLGFITPGKVPGFTRARFDELVTWSRNVNGVRETNVVAFPS